MIDWTFDQLQKAISEISYGEKLVILESPKDDSSVYILFKYPDRQSIRHADIQVDKVTRRAKRVGILTETEMEELLRARGIWTDTDDEIMVEMQEKIKKWKAKAINSDLTKTSQGYALELVAKLEEDMLKHEAKKERAMANTVERLARQDKYDFLLWASAYDPYTENRVWDTYENYLTYCKTIDDKFRSHLVGEFLQFLIGHSTEEVRYIARNNIWRIDFLVAQAGGLMLFPTSPRDLTPDQKNLLWWTKYYQSIYDMLPDDQPEDHVIEDDVSLDAYMEELHKERSKERVSRRAENKYGPSTAMKMKTALVMRSHPDYLRYEYDALGAEARSGKTDITLMDDPRMEGQRQKKGKAIQASRRYVPK